VEDTEFVRTDHKLLYFITLKRRLRAYGASYGKFLENESILFANKNQIVPQNLYLFVFDLRSLVTIAHFARNYTGQWTGGAHKRKCESHQRVADKLIINSPLYLQPI